MDERNVFLNPDKSQLCSRSVVWCGRRISAEGVTFDEKMVEGLMKMDKPINGQQLQQFVCGCNWLRAGIPKFAEQMEPLYALLRKLTQQCASSKEQF